ncbi:MAG: selenide, water dikinase SelD [Acidimicrobiales bacterium]
MTTEPQSPLSLQSSPDLLATHPGPPKSRSGPRALAEQASSHDEPVRLTEWTACGGCAAKWGGAPLAELMRQMGTAKTSAELLVGLAPSDDAAVYRLSENEALVSTTDFFPPLVDDPADFGAVAAANACSDVFAMGGRVVLALNISAFPDAMPVEVIATILRAAAEVVTQAGGVVAGGHTIRSEEPIFGLAVQGLVHPARIFRKSGARPGDVLVLSKPLGTGLVLAGGSAADKAEAVLGMRQLNRAASEVLAGLGAAIHAVTDVTGFGLLGHGWEMAERSSAGLAFEGAALPSYPGALAAARAGTRTGGDARNRAFLGGRVSSSASAEVEALAFDPQTSGGLLAAVTPTVLGELEGAGFRRVGTVATGDATVTLSP